MAKQAATRHRFICFTVHENAERFYQHWMVDEMPQGVSYLVYQLEKCPETARIHVQGYAEAKYGKSYDAWKKAFNCKSMHLEGRKGSASQAAEYCQKEESRHMPPVERGEISKQGKRSDLDEAALLVKMGGNLSAVAEAYPTQFIRYHSGFKALKLTLTQPQLRKGMHTFFVSGASGCGKTLWAQQTYPNAFMASDTKEGWMDGYDGQKEIIIDEFEGLFPRQLMLRMMDATAMKVPIKGGFVALACTVLVITTNKRWQDCFCGITGTDPAWQRRVTDQRICTIIESDDERLKEAIERKLLEVSAEVADDIVPQSPAATEPLDE